MTALPMTAGPDGPGESLFLNRRPVSWINAVADQVALEASLVRTADIEDLVIIAYVGLLDSPDSDCLSQDHLLRRCRRQLVAWAWEQGNADEPIQSSAALTGDQNGTAC